MYEKIYGISRSSNHTKVSLAWMHPKYLKKVRISKTFACQDEIGTKVGDEVVISECRPLSATKHFRVEEVVKAGTLVVETKKPVKKEKSKAKKK